MKLKAGFMEPIIATQEFEKGFPASAKSMCRRCGAWTLTVQEGEFLAVVGPSGCGKSTLLHVLGGLTSPTSGTVLVDGNDFTCMNDSDRTRFRRHKIGFVFQRFNLLPTLTARQNIAIAQHIQGNGFNPHRFDAVVEMLGIQPETCPQTLRAVGRGAATGGDCAGGDLRAQDSARRRTHGEPRHGELPDRAPTCCARSTAPSGRPF